MYMLGYLENWEKLTNISDSENPVHDNPSK